MLFYIRRVHCSEREAFFLNGRYCAVRYTQIVYEVRDKELIVVVIAVGKQERNTVYKAASTR